jgi:tRNA dimethylallyltransferase
MKNSPVFVIVGPTASGKTALAIKLARQYGGEIISADSRAIYKGMDIGTAKPTAMEQAAVQHWGIDLVNPDQRFTAYDFQQYALAKIKDVQARGRVAFLVGGTGLYVDAVVYGYEFGVDRSVVERQNLSKLSTEELLKCCKNYNIKLPENWQNRRYLIRAIETRGRKGDNRQKLAGNYVMVGIDTDPETLRARITDRAEQFFSADIMAETRNLAKKYHWGSEAMKSNIYPIVWRLIQGEISLDEAKKLFIFDDWHLAKRQLTWFRRNPNITWLPPEKAEDFLTQKLNQLQK